VERLAKTVYFHLGLHKTATSWLQRQVFPGLGLSVYRTRKFEKIEQLAVNGAAGAILVSHEGLGGRISDEKAPGDALAVFTSTIERITAIHKNSKVLIGFREHADWINSAYAQRGKKHLVTPEQYRETYAIDDMLWMRRVELCDRYGLQSFLFLYEEFKHDPPTLIADLCNFLGAPLMKDIGVSLARRENPSPRTERGFRVSRAAYAVAEKLGRLPWINPKRLRASALRLGSHFDSEEAPPPRIILGPAEKTRLEEDWKDLVSLISERRCRNFWSIAG
jgi:hypothetical protein